MRPQTERGWKFLHGLAIVLFAAGLIAAVGAGNVLAVAIVVVAGLLVGCWFRESYRPAG